jgi:alkanesulfonate monooxygenase SsuD/methylene tetrahydromethanopterin reductase-like flavin-dependent oxidoreductase (luciferase family)
LVEQACTALDHGMSGVTISEHHAGFPGYVPCPAVLATAILGATDHGWVAPSPLLLTLRPVPLVMEEIAWLTALHPGRVAAGLAAGYSERDFAVFGVDRGNALRSFRTKLDDWHQIASGEDTSPLRDDPAVAGVLPQVPILVLTGGPKTAAFAAQRGFGLLLPPQGADQSKNQTAMDSYLAAGGSGPRAAGQWVWLGDPPRAGFEALAQAYPDTDSSGRRRYAPAVVHDTDPDALAERLLHQMHTLRLSSINLRVHLPGVDAETTLAQIRTLAHQLVPRLESALHNTTQN